VQDQPSESARKRPHLGVIVRVVVYGTALSYFGWQAAQRFITERAVADDNFRASLGQWLQHPPKTIIMPNGEAMPVLEITEDEAKRMGLLPKSAERDADAQPEPNLAPQAAPEPTAPEPTAPEPTATP
jgi:hypothetical protein